MHTQNSSSVMVWCGVSYEGVKKIYFCEKGMKTMTKVYQDTILETILNPLELKLFQWTRLDFSTGQRSCSKIEDYLAVIER